ncbi:MAG TPA: zinc ribbon domain-containing protein [Candidatus Methylomirabilis sp.]|nr:zinc ribbon domain-containing protein [Candidatus Methylomirabilis sp.]
MGADQSSRSPSYCTRCGFAISLEAAYCSRCGLTIAASPEPHLPDLPHDPPREAPAGSDEAKSTLEDFLLGLDVLKRHPVIITPPLIAMGVVFAVVILFFGGAMGLFAVGGITGHRAGMMGAMVASTLLVLAFVGVAALIHLVSSAVVVAMAGDVLAAREPSLAASYRAVMARLGDVVAASFLSAVIIGVASLFLIIPGLIAAFFLVFTLPSLLLDGAGPAESLRLSARLVRNNIGRTFGLVIGAMVATIVTWLVSTMLHAAPVLGHLASILLAAAFVTYLTVVVVRVFHALPRS